ncbi:MULTISPECIES: hypothetical protein [unclassified Pseudoalteromonas]|uniref:hypothetical protein n=1 Tax=unclassified Pseudoalteromonas TaxID=194690 RepID=UPI0025745869|nr:hypothetical protein [Pseudoalteromonas sp. MM1]BED91131.1 hypothetical protein PspMM1_35990 [Pseudoalteromonas sp. MM1]
MKKGIADIFETDSVIKILVLCVVTIGSYLIYKLYRFSSQINRHTNHKIPNSFIYTAITLFAISLVSLIYALASFHDQTILKSSIGIHIVSSVFDVTWIIMVRNRINLISGSIRGDQLWLNPFVTSIFHVIYMQHKINQSMVKGAI